MTNSNMVIMVVLTLTIKGVNAEAFVIILHLVQADEVREAWEEGREENWR